MRRRYLLRAWRSERGSQGLEAAGAALAAALIVLALLAGARSTLGPRVFEAFQCAASALTGGGSCGDGGAADTTGTPPEQAEESDDDDGGFGILDGIQLGLDVVGLVPGFGEVADGVNGLISLARGDETGAALSFAAMIPFAGWGATGARWVRNGVRYSDEIAGATRYSDEAAAAVRGCTGRAAPGKGPGLAKPLQNACDILLRNGRQVRGNFPDTAGPNEVLYRVNPQTGNVSHYEVYDAQGLPIKRVDLEGRAHGGVPTPHVLEYTRNVDPRTGRVFVNKPRTVRPANPDEIPSGTP